MITDYIFYKLHEQYSKQKWNTNPCSSASLFLSGMELLVVYCVVMIIRIVIPQWQPQNRTVAVIVFFSAMFIAYRINYQYYKPRVEVLREKYTNHKANRWFKNWMVFVIMIFLFVFPILLSSFLHALGV